jgi:hypothetical protein
MNRMENLPRPTADNGRSNMEEVAKILDLTAIFNKHDTAEDALETIEKIESMSIVYVEGMKLEEIDESDILILTEKLGRYQRVHGINHYYQKKKRQLLNLIREYLDDAESDDTVNVYLGTLYLKLLEKDCQIVAADYSHTIDNENQSEIDATTQKIYRQHKIQEDGLLHNVQTDSDLEEHLNELELWMLDRHESHDLRETLATDIIIHDVASIIKDRDWYQSVPWTSTGKIKAYVCYGAGHTRSLLNKLTAQGIDVTPEYNYTLNESRYLDDTRENFQSNYLRRLSHTAFDAIAGWLHGGDHDTYVEVTDYMFDSLKTVNNNRDKAVDFCLRCLRIHQKQLTDYAESVKDYVKLVMEHGIEIEIE